MSKILMHCKLLTCTQSVTVGLTTQELSLLVRFWGFKKGKLKVVVSLKGLLGFGQGAQNGIKLSLRMQHCPNTPNTVFFAK